MDLALKRPKNLLHFRYHVDGTQRFGQLKPGLPSRNLQEALGLRENQLPPYIYRMREVGYPPGWLKEAEIHHSGKNIRVEHFVHFP